MRKKGNISRYTAEELAAKEARGEDRTDWAAVAAKTEDELAAHIASDPAWERVPGDWVSRADATTGLMRRPGEKKRQVTMRFDADVLEFFKRAGRGWQGRMNAVLRSFMDRQGHRH
ncbi:MAG: BrnA antitoxin family protein [Stellaceae bacterium]